MFYTHYLHTCGGDACVMHVDRREHVKAHLGECVTCSVCPNTPNQIVSLKLIAYPEFLRSYLFQSVTGQARHRERKYH